MLSTILEVDIISSLGIRQGNKNSFLAGRLNAHGRVALLWLALYPTAK